MSLSKISDINALPNELLYLILKNLSIKEKIRAERVCKKWQQILKRLFLSQNSLKINSGWSLGHYSGCTDHKHNEKTGEIHFLCISTSIWTFRNDINIEKLSPIMKRCPNIRSIQLENCVINWETFLWLIEKSPKLECLALIEIAGFDLNEWELIVEKLGKKLIHFAISDCQHIYSQSLIPIIPQLQELCILYHPSPLNEVLTYLGPNIRKVMIKCCEESNVDAVKSLASGWGKNITHLSIDDPWIDDEIETLKHVCRYLKNLEYLSIGFGALSPAIRPIIKLKKLRQLELNANLDRWFGILTLPLNSMNGIQYLLLNAYFGPKNLVGLEKVFPNIKHLILYFYCDCTENIKTYYCFCKTCHKKCFDFIHKMKLLNIAQLNGQKYMKKIRD